MDSCNCTAQKGSTEGAKERLGMKDLDQDLWLV